MDFLGTVRGRLDYAFDRFLVYDTGGFAYGDVNERSRFFLANGTPLTYAGGCSGLQTGYTYGGGVEYALPTVANNTGTYTESVRTDGDLDRIGLNYKF